MKFAHKLSVAVIALLAVIFSIGGTLLVNRVFDNALAAAVQQNTSRHLLERYSLEAEMLALTVKGEPVTDERLANHGATLTEYLGRSEQMLAIFTEDGGELFTSLPALPQPETRAALAAGEDECTLLEAAGGTYMLMASAVEGGGRTARLLSCFNVSGLYEERAQNLAYFWRLEAVLLLCAAGVVLLVSTLLTLPVKKLNDATRRMAAGAYGERAAVRSRDEIGQLAASFNAMAGAVQQNVEGLHAAVQQREDFVAAFTHEIKTPMTTLIGYGNILRTSECTPEVRQRAAGAIFHESTRLEKLSQKLLALLGLGRRPPALAPVPLEEVFYETARSLGWQQSPVRLVFAPAPGAPTATLVLAERDLLVDMLRNLIQNARRASPTDGVVHITATPQGEECRLAVRDAGRGIPPEELARITEPFYVVDKSRSRAEGGSGLGLALCEKIAALHGTRLHIASQVGRGTEVSFTLRLCGPDDEANPPDEAEADAPQEEAGP